MIEEKELRMETKQAEPSDLAQLEVSVRHLRDNCNDILDLAKDCELLILQGNTKRPELTEAPASVPAIPPNRFGMLQQEVETCMNLLLNTRKVLESVKGKVE